MMMLLISKGYDIISFDPAQIIVSLNAFGSFC